MHINRMFALMGTSAYLVWFTFASCSSGAVLTIAPQTSSQPSLVAASSPISPEALFTIRPNAVISVKRKSSFAWFSGESKIIFQKDEWFVASAPKFVPDRLPGANGDSRLWAGSLPLVSPKDSSIAFNATRITDDTESLWVMSRDGSELHDILPGDLAHTGTSNAKLPLRWLSSSSLLYTTHCGSGCWELWLVNIDQDKIEKIVGGIGARFVTSGLAYDVSPKGDKLVITRNGDYSLNFAELKDDRDLHPVGTGRTGLQEFQSWAPNQSEFFYTQWSGFFPLNKEVPSLVVWDTHQHKSEIFVRKATQLAISPNGDLLGFVLLGNPIYDRQERIIDTDWKPEQIPILNLVVLERDTQKQVAIIPLGSTHAASKLFGSSFFRPTWSPDGTQLTYRDSNRNVWNLDLQTKYKKLIVTAPESSQILWSFDSQWLAVAKGDQILIYPRQSLTQ